MDDDELRRLAARPRCCEPYTYDPGPCPDCGETLDLVPALAAEVLRLREDLDCASHQLNQLHAQIRLRDQEVLRLREMVGALEADIRIRGLIDAKEDRP